jgi:hypothetical protein
VLRHQRGELANQRGVPAERQLGLDPVLQARLAQLLQPPGLDRGERLVELRQRRPAPQRERVTQARNGLRGGPAGKRSAALLSEPFAATVRLTSSSRRASSARRPGAPSANRRSPACHLERAQQTRVEVASHHRPRYG